MAIPKKCYFFMLLGVLLVTRPAEAKPMSLNECLWHLVELANPHGWAFETFSGQVKTIRELPRDQPTLVVVDGYSSGANYAIRARELFGNINVIHVKTNRVIAPGFRSSFIRKHYDANVVYSDGRLDRIVSLLENFKQGGLAVVAGTETSPRVRALLTDALGIPGADLDLADARTNKFLMEQAVSPYVKTIPTAQFSKPEDAWNWVQQQGFDLPFIAKPTEAAGGEGVTVVHSFEELKEAFKRTLNRRNILNRKEKTMLVQPFLSHEKYTEYVIDTVIDPELGTTVANVLEYKKQIQNGNIVYRTTRILPDAKNRTFFNAFLKTATGVAKGLGVRSGVLHIEVFVRNDSPPENPDVVFIEAGERPAGAGLPMFVRDCEGSDMITLQLLSLFDRDRFKQMAGKAPFANRDGMQIDLLGPTKEGILARLPTEEEFRQRVPAYFSHSLHMDVGTLIGPTRHLIETPGHITVIGSTRNVDVAEKAVREWEANGFYPVRTPRYDQYYRRPFR